MGCCRCWSSSVGVASGRGKHVDRKGRGEEATDSVGRSVGRGFGSVGGIIALKMRLRARAVGSSGKWNGTGERKPLSLSLRFLIFTSVFPFPRNDTVISRLVRPPPSYAHSLGAP